ncbi:monovalent cation/H(+) antiporter subunit G [Halalkalibacter nanhaiisediminis]|uniref:Multisubunit sodium/proton antiporter, MrpG subunit (TC 2.A.63.1) n=1 Tax=Halalkalibacter nanhaiisediminis TaxID=688079 RepID=A0A562QHW8_9BACI|nr:monovalent cation/H(+) antiporter subunit G [Halalkalibacter nanhaiisediminis]TWI56358.1 multisubunit sodium/proton antiporter, MrpG subunit (TC 2.A.63.1) [Halalkalibacter nanhaiisediminis]
MTATEIVISFFVVAGGFLSLLASIGLIRLPDVYGRTHAASKSTTLGVMFIMIATFLFFLLVQGEFVGKILLTIVFVFITAPVAGLMIGRSAYRTGVPLWEKSKQDDLKKMYAKKTKQT